MFDRQFMSSTLAAKIDDSRYPNNPKCMHCGSGIGHTEEVWTGATGEADLSGWEVWFCCHECRDKDMPCETFYPMRLKPGTTRDL